MSEDPIGNTLDELGITYDLMDGERIVDAVVVMRIIDTTTMSERWDMTLSPHTGPVVQNGLVLGLWAEYNRPEITFIHDEEEGFD